MVYNLLLALKKLKRYGYDRIGICLSQFFDRTTHHVVGAIARDLAATSPKSKIVPPLFYLADGKAWRPSPKQEILTWIRRYQPDVVVGHHFRLVQWAEEEGYAVPKDLGIVHLAIDDDVLDWAGIHSNRKQIGRTAAELLISLMQNRQFGVPATGLETTIRGSWRDGRTLRLPSPQ